MSPSISVLLGSALLALPLLAQAAVHDLYWNISYVENVNPDGEFPRRVIGVNGTWPPPPVEVTQFDTLRIHAYNGLGDVGTALHTHGNYFNGSGYYDGAVGVTQCAIPPGETLVYDIPTDLQYGTYWIHGHYTGQYVDGLRTPFIIQPNTSRTDVTWDEEYTLIIGDWYHDQHKDLIPQFLTKYNPTGAEPVPDTTSVNYFYANGSYVASYADLMSGAGTNEKASINFVPGKTYKIRVINMAAFSMYYVWLDGHDNYIIEADSIDVEPYLVDNVPIAVAQRYAFLFTAKNDTSSNYKFNINANPDMYDTYADTLALNRSVNIVYDKASPTADSAVVPSYDFFNDLLMVPLNATYMEMAPADVTTELTFGFDTFTNGNNRAYFNDVTYQSPIVPSLLTEMTMGNDSWNEGLYGAQSNALTFEYMKNIQFTIINTDSGQHPFHLHGHSFQVVHRSFDITSDDPTINPPLVEGQINPFKRDTIMVPPGGSTSIRFRADNPGAWFFHCHIDWHLSSGLAATILIAPDETQKRLTLPAAITSQCAAQGLPTGGNAVGLYSTTDLTGQPLGPWPIQMGWTAKAKGAMAGCVLAALIGMISVVWYSWGSLGDEEIEAEERRRYQQKAAAKAAKQGKGLGAMFKRTIA